MSQLKFVVAAAVLLLAAVSVTEAGTIYDTFGSGNSYNTSASYLVWGSGTALPQETASAFTPASSSILTSIDVALGYSGGTNSVVVKLLGDSSGLPDFSTVLETWSLSGLPALSVQTLTSSLNPTMSGGSQFWVAVLPGATDSQFDWNYNNQGFLGVGVDGGSGWQYFPKALAPAVRVSGTPSEAVPVPAAAWLGFGMLGLLGAARRLRRKRD